VFDEHGDGLLSEQEVVSTGGLGPQASGSAVDHLASQGSLVFDAAHQLLFAVNAGSGTLSVFSAEGGIFRLLHVLSSGGVFPNSVAVHGNVVYVLDAGGTVTVPVTGSSGTTSYLSPVPPGPSTSAIRTRPSSLTPRGKLGSAPTARSCW
jgi:hypothetical protein